MSARKANSRVWWSLAAAIVGGLAFAQRTRRYDLVHPELRSAKWWFRTPTFNRGLLLISRLVGTRPTQCVSGVKVGSYTVKAPDGSDLIVYVYRPANAEADGPGLLYTHGGGMIVGSVAGYHQIVSRYAAELGIVIVSTEYRLAPEHPFPAPLDDVHSAYQWLLSNAEALGVDGRRLIVAGESAGGGITAALCQRIHDGGDVEPVLQVLIYPMLDDRTALKPAPEYRGQLNWTPGSNRFGWSAYLGHKPKAATAPSYAAPSRRADLSGLPSAWIGVGSLDLFLEESVLYANRLKEAGVHCEFVEVEGAFHGFDLFSSQPVASMFHAEILQAIREVVGRPTPPSTSTA